MESQSTTSSTLTGATMSPPTAAFEPMANTTATMTPEPKKQSPVSYIIAGLIMVLILGALYWWGTSLTQLNLDDMGASIPMDTVGGAAIPPSGDTAAAAVVADIDADVQSTAAEIDAMDAEIDRALQGVDAQLGAQ